MKKVLISFIVSILLTPSAFAIEDNIQINLQQALDIAVEKNIDLKAAKMNIDIAQNKVKSANRLQNPEFNMFYNIGTAGRSEPQQLGFSELIEVGKRGVRKNLAKSNLELESENLRYAKFKLKMDVREAYINLVAEKSVLNTLEQQEKLQEQLYNVVEKRLKAARLLRLMSCKQKLLLIN